jgi:hypothetical protein
VSQPDLKHKLDGLTYVSSPAVTQATLELCFKNVLLLYRF